jgi:hypothetical protein
MFDKNDVTLELYGKGKYYVFYNHILLGRVEKNDFDVCCWYAIATSNNSTTHESCDKAIQSLLDKFHSKAD